MEENNQSTEPKLEETIVSEEMNEYSKIGGWLIFLALGIIVTPILNLNSLIKLIKVINSKAWPLIITESSKYYQAGFKDVVLFELVGISITIIFNIIILFFFFKKKRQLPNMMILLLIFNFVYGIIDFILISSTPALKSTSAQLNPQLFRAFTIAAIWIPYYMRSKRVKGTFVK